MLITHDKVLLYYAILLGIDVGFTTKKTDTDDSTYNYLVVFINNDTYEHKKSRILHNYLTRQSGGKTQSNKQNINLKTQNKQIQNKSYLSNLTRKKRKILKCRLTNIIYIIILLFLKSRII
jgi:hypothetical protein